jgi:hypothetical protein
MFGWLGGETEPGMGALSAPGSVGANFLVNTFASAGGGRNGDLIGVLVAIFLISLAIGLPV